jgi:hypothetical protein
MSTISLLADPSAPAVAASAIHVVQALPGMVHADGLSDWANTLIANWTKVVQGGTALVAIVLFLWVSAKARFAVATTILTAVLAGFVIWGVTFNGLGFFASGIQGETQGQVSISQLHGQEA